jgi:peptidoglycan/LPS O-acetylase OafA/YrhL
VTEAYRPDIDGLRALAVGAVVLFHAFPGTLPGGFLGVDVFFVISGFLITGMILEGARTRSFSLLGFYLRRARRILPALLAMLFAISVLAALVLMPDELERFADNVTASALFVPNLVFATQTGYFDAATETNPLLHLWSLGVEEQFYLLWPLVLMALAPRVRMRTLVFVIVGVIVASFAAHVVISQYSATASFYLPFTRFWQLLAGAVLAAHAAERGRREVLVPLASSGTRVTWRRDALSIAGLAFIAGSIVLTRPGGASFVGVSVPATLGAAMFIAAGPQALPNRTLFAWRPVVYVGLISYPLYLWHWPPLSLLRVLELDQGEGGRTLRIAAVLLATLAAVLTYHLIELPIRRRRDLPRLGLRLTSLLGAAAIAGVVVASTGGLPQRTSLDHDPFHWAPEMRLTESCSQRYGQPPEWRKNSFCVRSDFTREPSIVMIGDSHSNMFVPGVRAAYPTASVLQIGASACTYLRSTEFWNDNRRGWRRLCPQVIDGAYRAVGEQTHLVILTARIPMYTATAEEYANTFDFVSPKHFESPEFPGASPAMVYERALERDVTQLLRGGRDVVVMLPVPSLDFVPRACISIRPIDRFLPSRPPGSCTEPRAKVAAELATAQAIVHRVARGIASPHLHVVDPMDALCDDRVCHAVIAGELMYRDDNHLSIEGSRRVWASIRPRNLAVPGGPAQAYLSSQ